MHKILALLVLLISVTSCGPDPTPKLIREFSYDENSGLCKNKDGVTGFNNAELGIIRETKDCECMKFTRMEMLLVVGDSSQVPRFAYSRIEGYNFRGSVLDSCNLYFSNIFTADLRGADLSTLQYGYAFVIGRKDDFTKPPNEGNVNIVGDSIYCSR